MSVPVMFIDGDVIATHSYWTEDRSRIVSDATVRTADGQDVIVNQFGGSVDGIGMVAMPGPPILELGTHVAVAAHTALDARQQEHVVLDSVKVISYAPDYVRTTDSMHHPLHWASGCVYVTVDAAGTKSFPMDQELAAVDAVLEEWNGKTAACSSFQLINQGTRSVKPGNDKVNLIIIHDTASYTCMNGVMSWGGRPAVGSSPESCFSTQAAGVTTAVYISDPSSSRYGEIVDADVEINNVNFTVTLNGQPNLAPCHAELKNTLTHELGHLQGLEHTCWLDDGVHQNPMWTDNLGNPVPVCSAGNAQSIKDATMYPTQDCGETTKESLSPDDIQAMCDIYPKATPLACTAPSGTSGGCCSASGDSKPEGALLMAGMVALVMGRRRQRR
jgi:MYXO-CTERM domain-containing protein